VPDGEPPADVVRRLEYARYKQIEDAGGMPVTMTATGQGITLHPKLYDVRKEKCTPSPQQPKGHFECEMTIRLTLMEGDDEPSEQGERIGIQWDGRKGEWVLE